MFHLKDVENVKENAGEVIEVQQELQPEIQRNVGKYHTWVQGVLNSGFGRDVPLGI